MTRFGRDQSGATAIEYGMIIALMFLAIVAAVTLFATNTGGMFDRIKEAIAGAIS